MKNEEFLGFISVFEHLASNINPKLDVTAAKKINNNPTATPSFLKAKGIANKPAPTMVFTKFVIDDPTVAVGLSIIAVNTTGFW